MVPMEEERKRVLVLGDLPQDVQRSLEVDDTSGELERLLGGRFYRLIVDKVGSLEGGYRGIEIVRHSDEGLDSAAIVHLMEVHRPQGVVVTITVDMRDAAIARAASRLGVRALGTNSVGYDHLVIPDLTAARLPLFFTPGVFTMAVAQHAVTMMLYLVNNIGAADSYVKGGAWTEHGDSAAQEALQVEDFFKLTVGIVGLGRIGSEVMKLLAQYGPDILWHDSRQDVVEREGEIADAYSNLAKAYGHSPTARSVGFVDLLARSDVITVHTDLNQSTRGLFGESAFSAMREGAIFVNAARGGIVDYEALFRHIEDGRLRGVGLDVFPEEPISGRTRERLSRMPNVLATPHVADNRRATRSAGWSLVLFAVANYLLDRSRPTNVVNPEVLGQQGS